MCACVRAFVCVCVCVRARARARARVCVCVCVRERERERERERDRWFLDFNIPSIALDHLRKNHTIKILLHPFKTQVTKSESKLKSWVTDLDTTQSTANATI